MAERDAFGRKQGEDSLADMGWTSSSPADEQSVPMTPAPAPVVAAPLPVEPPRPAPVVSAPIPAEPARQAPVAPAPPRRLRRRRRRGFARLIVFLVIVVIAAVNAGAVMEWGREKADELEGTIRDAVPTATAPPPVGLEGESLFRTAALREALAELPNGRIELLRVAPERIDAQVDVDGRMQIVQVTSDGRLMMVESPTGGRGAGVRVDPAAPARIVRTAARRAGRDPASVSYLVLMRVGDVAEWQLFFADGLHYSASASGKRVRRVG